MKTFTPTRRENPCQICSSASGKCRETEAVLLCMTFADDIEKIPGYKFIGRTKDDRWGKWILDDGKTWTKEQREEWRKEQERRKKLIVEEELQQRKVALPADERDYYYQQLLSQLTLNKDDRADLLRRGLTDEQIADWGVKSVRKWQRLQKELPCTLPGVSSDGRSLNTPFPGYLCPVRDTNGQIVAIQIRTRNPNSDEPKYYWLTSKTKKRPNGPTPHLLNGELPLSFFSPTQRTRQAIALVEGTGAKPFITAQRREVITIGAAGGQFAGSPQTLKQILDEVATYSSKVIEFYPDAGAVDNHHVLRQYQAAWELLRDWGYEVQVMWWGQLTKEGLDIDELANFGEIQDISPSKLLQLSPYQSYSLFQQIAKAGKRCPWKLDRTGEVKLEGEKKTNSIIEYAEGERRNAWMQARREGYKYVLEQSIAGLGKSTDAGKTEPKMFGVEKSVYLSNQSRNPTVDSLKIENGWFLLFPRHDGFISEPTPGGGKRLKRRDKKGGSYAVEGNCVRNGLIGTLRQKNVSGVDTASVSCGTCGLREACSNGKGIGYGFLSERRIVLDSTKFRAHPDSMPSVDSDPPFNYSNTVLFWDEAGETVREKKTISVTLPDVQQIFSLMAIKSPLLFEQVRQLLTQLHACLDGTVKIGKYGLGESAGVRQLLPALPEVDIIAIEELLKPDLSFLDSTREYGIGLADLPPSVRKKFSDPDSDATEKAAENVVKQWLADLLRVLTGQINGALQLSQRELKITLPDTRHAEMAQAAKFNIFLDATLTREDLALKLGVDPNEIQVMRQAVPECKNLEISQIAGLGRLGMERGADQQKRVKALISHYKKEDPTTKVIDFKKFAEQNDGAWWRDSRGSNDFLYAKTLLVIGVPCRNMTDLEAEFTILYGRPPQAGIETVRREVTLTNTLPEGQKPYFESQESIDPEFREFVRRKILADIEQAAPGRIRAHRRQDEKLRVIFLGDYPLNATVTLIAASDIVPEAAPKKERTKTSIQEAVATLKEQGKKVTQTAVAELAGVSQGYVSRNRELLQTLLESHSKSNNFDSPGEEEIAEVLDAAVDACQNSEEVLESIDEVFHQWLEPQQWLPIWNATRASTQTRVLKVLSLTLRPPETKVIEDTA